MLKRIALLALLALAACGAPASPEPPRTPTLVLPTRVPVQATAAPDSALGGARPTQPPVVAAQPSATPTRVRPTLTPTMTLIPPTATPAPPTETPVPSATPTPNVEAGRALFINGVAGKPDIPTCLSCHNIDPNSTEVKTGPMMVGVAARAANRVLGQSPRQYLYNSIVQPNAFLVPNEGDQVYAIGNESLMYQFYERDLTPEQIHDLVGYLLTLR